MSRPRIVLVANPHASQFTGGDHRIVRATLENRYEVEALWPTSVEHARDVVAHRVQDGINCVVAMGGDGVVHHIVQPLVGSEVALGIIPVGTTNVFARLVGIPPDAGRAARLIVDDPEISQQPTVRLRFGEGANPGSRHALFATGIGFDADVVASAETEPHRKLRFGSVHYASTALRILWKSYRSDPHTFSVSSQDNQAEAAAVLAQFHPAYTYFGRFPLQIDRDSPDPMTLLLIEKIPLLRLPRAGLRLLRRVDLGAVPGFHTWPGVTEAVVSSNVPVNLQADGELLGAHRHISVEYVAEGIRVMTPRPRRSLRVRLVDQVWELVSRFPPWRDAR